MPGACRLGDTAKCPNDSHGCLSCSHMVQGVAVQGSIDVTINNKPALRKGDAGVHGICCGTNTWKAAEGSQTVIINNKPAARIGDRTAHCGGSGSMIEGSGNVVIGDGQGRLFTSAANTHAPFVQNIAADRELANKRMQENMEYLSKKGRSSDYFNSKLTPVHIETVSNPEVGKTVAGPSIFEFFDGKKPGEIYDWGKGEFTENAGLYAHDLNRDEIDYLRKHNLKRINADNLTAEQAKKATELFGSSLDSNAQYANWRTRARILNYYKFTHPATQAGFKHYYRFTRDLNPANFALERGYQIGSGKEMFSGEKVSRAGAGAEFVLAIAVLKGMGKLSKFAADDSIDGLTSAERNLVDDVARQMASDIEQSQAAALRATEKIKKLPVKYQGKTVASDGYQTLSGWDAKTTSAPDGYSRIDASQIKEYSETISHKITKSGRDINFPGQTFSSHAEKQLTMMTDEPIGVSRKMCTDCQKFFSKHSQYTGKTLVVTDPEMTRVFTPDGKITGIPLKK